MKKIGPTVLSVGCFQNLKLRSMDINVMGGNHAESSILLCDNDNLY